MIRRIEKVQLICDDYDELMVEAYKEINEKKEAGWRIHSYQTYADVGEYSFTFHAEQREPYSK